MSSVDDYILKFCLNCALRDATVQQAYAGTKPSLPYLLNGTKVTTSTGSSYCAFDIVKEFVNNIISGGFIGKTQDDYDKIFYDAAMDIRLYMRTNSFGEWTFGNSQKLINMTLKYLYPICYGNSTMSVNFQNCHCPADSVMLIHVCDKIKDSMCPTANRLKENAIANYIGDKKISGYTKTEFVSGWSNEEIPTYADFEYSRYNTFQRAIRKIADGHKLLPLEYDFFAW